MNLVSDLTLPHTEGMKMIDSERLDKIRGSLEAIGIDPDKLPEPDSEEWDALVRSVSQRDLGLGQEFLSLAYDPMEQANREMIEEQARRASMGKRGVLTRIQTVTTTKSVNGDKVPDTKLIRNVLVGAGVVAAATLLLWPSPSEKQATKTTTTKTTAVAGEKGKGQADTQKDGKAKSNDAIPTPEQAGVKQNPDSTVAANPLGIPQSPTSGTDIPSSTAPAPDSTLYVPPTQSQPQYTPEPTPVASSGPDSGGSESLYVPPAQSQPQYTSEPTPVASSGPDSGGSESLYVPPAASSSSGASEPVTLTPDAGQSASSGSDGPKKLTVSPPASVPVTQTSAAPTLQQTTSTPTAAPRPALVQNSGGAASGDKAEARAKPALVQSAAADGTTAKPALVQSAAQNAAGKPALVQSTATEGRVRTTGLVSSAAQGQQGSNVGGQGGVSTQANENGGMNQASSGSGQSRSYGLLAHQSSATNQTGVGQGYGLQQGASSQPQQVQATVSGVASATTEKKYGLISTTPPAQQVAQAVTQGAQAVAQGQVPSTSVAAASVVKFPYVMGQTLKATLMTGTGVVDGASNPVPVYAQAEDGSVWRGTVSLDGRKRLQIAFNAVAKDSNQFDVSAYAYSPSDGMAALPVKITATAPNAAYDIFNGIARGAQTFAQAMINQKTVTYQQNMAGTGTTSTTNATPNFWLTAGAGLIGSFAVPEMKSSVVMVGQLPAKTPLNIVVNGSGSGNGQTQ